MAHANAQIAAGFRPLAFVGEWLNKAKTARANYAIYAQTYSELNAMSDRELADINVSRAQIEDIARAAVYGK